MSDLTLAEALDRDPEWRTTAENLMAAEIERLQAALFLAVADANRCDPAQETRTTDDYLASAQECIDSGTSPESWIGFAAPTEEPSNEEG